MSSLVKEPPVSAVSIHWPLGKAPLQPLLGVQEESTQWAFLLQEQRDSRVLYNISHISPQFRLHHNDRMWVVSSQPVHS